MRCVDPIFFLNVIRTSFIIPQKSHDPSQSFNVDVAEHEDKLQCDYGHE